MQECSNSSRVIGSTVTYKPTGATVDILNTNVKLSPPDVLPTGVSQLQIAPSGTSRITFQIDESICGKPEKLQLIGDDVCVYTINFNKPCNATACCTCPCKPPWVILFLILIYLILKKKLI